MFLPAQYPVSNQVLFRAEQILSEQNIAFLIHAYLKITHKSIWRKRHWKMFWVNTPSHSSISICLWRADIVISFSIPCKWHLSIFSHSLVKPVVLNDIYLLIHHFNLAYNSNSISIFIFILSIKWRIYSQTKWVIEWIRRVQWQKEQILGNNWAN
jgi:hypothetical protein